MGKMNFKAAAISATSLSPIMEGRPTKLGMDDIISKYPDGVTVTEFDFVTLKATKEGESDKTFPVLAFEEDKSAYFFGGYVLAKICADWVTAYEGDVAAASEDLKADGGVKMRFKRGTTKGSKSITTVEII